MSSTKNRIDLEVSRRFDVLKLLLMILVIMIHAEKGVQAYVDPVPDFARWVILFFGHNLCRVAVPLFFAISGYLLFLNYDPSLSGYLGLLKKKFRTIAIPFLLFNALFIALILIFHKIPYIGDVNTLRERGYFAILVGIGGHPVNYTLWFLRDLMIYLAVSPMFYVMAKEIPYTGIVIWYALWNFMQQRGVPIELSGAFFFYLGGALSMQRVPLGGKSAYLWPAAGVYFLLMLVGVYLEDKGDLGALFFLIHRFNLVLGVFVFWNLTAFPAIRDNRKLLSLAGFSFFIYLAHEPILSYCIYSTRYLFEVVRPGGQIGTLIYFFLLTAVVFFLALNLGKLLLRFTPRLYAVATGARAPRASQAPRTDGRR